MDEIRNKLIELQTEAIRKFMATATNTPLVGFITDHLIANGVTVQRWIPVEERLPENEVDVLVLCERRLYGINELDRRISKHVAMAFHTDGTTNTEDSGYTWELWDTGADYDEEADAYIIPEGWWESVLYGNEFSAVDDFVTHWMPLPEPPGKDVGGDE